MATTLEPQHSRAVLVDHLGKILKQCVKSVSAANVSTLKETHLRELFSLFNGGDNLPPGTQGLIHASRNVSRIQLYKYLSNGTTSPVRNI